MNNHGLSKENLMAMFPVALQKDPSVVALAEIVAGVLAKRPEEIDWLRIYPAIDQLDEPLLDILAYDFKVDWWDADYSLEEKRRTLKGSWRVHKTLGTKAAVETALRAIYPKAWAEPWFKYEGGEPYHFRLHIDLSDELWSEGKPQSVLDRVRFYQSLRDHMDSVQYTMALPPALLHVGGAAVAHVQMGLPQGEDEFDFRNILHAGGTSGIHASAGVHEAGDNFSFRDKISLGGKLSAQERMPVPESTAPPPSTTILRTGGVCTIISNLSKGE